MQSNVTTTVEGNKLHIIVDLTAPGSPSKSGKSTIIATTSGFLAISPTVSLSLNVIRK